MFSIQEFLLCRELLYRPIGASSHRSIVVRSSWRIHHCYFRHGQFSGSLAAKTGTKNSFPPREIIYTEYRSYINLIIHSIRSRYISFASDYGVEKRNTKFTHEKKFLYLWSRDCDVWILNRQMFISINVSNVEIELVALLLLILNTSGSNIGPKTGYYDGYFGGFPQFIHVNVGIVR
jgi:hypothetical protein